MCGRYTLIHEELLLEQMFEAEMMIHLMGRYNIAPSQPIPIVRHDLDIHRRQINFAQWGLIPSWAKDPAIGNRMINARSESLREKPSFRGIYNLKRCLIPASGFYEWDASQKKNRTPHYIHLLDESLFAFAGLWDTWHDPGGAQIDTCTIITTAANAMLQELHHRMPVIIPREYYNRWLDPTNQTAKGLDELLTPYPADEMHHYSVSTAVNKPANDSPDLIKPAPPTTLFG
ncbi:SOS response-associated peptidase [Poriferisphaera sp. WC338]|uniref:SOS response-associated peptidase n=1 Tax=Poriferisphaera sp. WC338 TaxID=3425129 RepID=UPI003D8195A7